MNTRVEFRCNKCRLVYGFDDPSPFFFNLEPGETTVSPKHSCPYCGGVSVTTMSISASFDGIPEQETEWPDFIDA